MRNNVTYVPLYVQKDKDGVMIEDCSGKTTITVKN
jgi:hypothetical protein